MKLKKWATWILFFLPFCVHAVSTTSLTVMSADDVGQLLIKNDSHTDMRYHISAQEVSFPNGKHHEVKGGINTLNFNERYFSLMPGAEKRLVLTYHGDMNKERYYRLSIQESPACRDCGESNSPLSNRDRKGSEISLNSVVRPLVIVAPQHPSYRYEERHSVIKNTGNGSMVMLLDDVCTQKALHTWLIAPGDKFDVPDIKKTERLSIGMGDRIVSVFDNTCPKNYSR